MDLSYNRIGNTGASSLFEALPANFSLTNFDLRGNSIGKTGAASLKEVAEKNNTVNRMYAYKCSLSEIRVVILTVPKVIMNVKRQPKRLVVTCSDTLSRQEFLSAWATGFI